MDFRAVIVRCACALLVLLATPGSGAAQEDPDPQPSPPQEQSPPEAGEPEQDRSPEPEIEPGLVQNLRQRWKIGAELSVTDQSGNQVLRLLTAGLQISHREKEAFELEGAYRTRYGQSEGEVVTRNHFGSLSFDLHPRDRWSPFLYFTAERDPFRRLDLRFSGGAGAKYTFHEGEAAPNELSTSLALLYTYEDLRPIPDDPFGPNRSRARWSLRLRGGRQLRPGVSLQHTTFYQPIWDEMADYLLRSETTARVLLTERLALSVSYQLDRTSRPPESVGPDDRLLKTGLIIDF